MLQRTVICTLLALGVALAVVGPVDAERGPGDDARPWATVNVCDTEDHPDTIGIRGSMPGSDRRAERMYMRFTVQYETSEGEWRDLSHGGRSDWEYVGRGSHDVRQAGRWFEIRPASGEVRLRGIVRFEWRRGDRVVRRATRTTSSGHRSAAGADPRGYSRSTCVLRR